MGLLKSGNHEKKGGLFWESSLLIWTKLPFLRTVYLASPPVLCGNEARNGFSGVGVGLRIAPNVHTEVPDAVKYRDATCVNFLVLALPWKWWILNP